jgi:hypothetical protein
LKTSQRRQYAKQSGVSIPEVGLTSFLYVSSNYITNAD